MHFHIGNDRFHINKLLELCPHFLEKYADNFFNKRIFTTLSIVEKL